MDRNKRGRLASIAHPPGAGPGFLTNLDNTHPVSLRSLSAASRSCHLRFRGGADRLPVPLRNATLSLCSTKGVMESRTDDALPALNKPAKRPGLAWILSFLIPGAGHLYCGYRKRALYAFLTWLVTFILLRVGRGPLGGNVWFLAFRVELVLYIFAPVDAYLTARDALQEIPAAPFESPRIAALLNLLTNGLGYWYLGKRKKAWTVFISLGVLSLAAQHVASHTLRSVLYLAYESALLFIAWDAFQSARHPDRSGGRMADSPALLSLGLSQPPVVPLPAASADLPAVAPPSTTSASAFPPATRPHVLHPAFPIGFACLLGAGYLALAALGIAMPDYRQIDQTHAGLTTVSNSAVYRNPVYGIQVTVPMDWVVAPPSPRIFIAASSPDLDCSFRLSATGSPPFQSAAFAADQASAQFSNLGSPLQLIGRKLVRFGNLQGQQVLFSIKRQHTVWIQGFVFAKRGLSMYLMSTRSLDDGTDVCQDALAAIRHSVRIGQK